MKLRDWAEEIVPLLFDLHTQKAAAITAAAVTAKS